MRQEQLNYLTQQGGANMKKGSQIGGFIGGIAGTALGVGPVAGAAAGKALGAGVGGVVTGAQFALNPNGSTYQPKTAIFAKYGAELEKQETVMRPDGNMLSFNGPSHQQGGIGYNPKFNSEFVFSDSIGFDSRNKLSLSPNKTFAQVSKKFQGRDPISQNSLNMLKQDNKRILKMFQTPQFKYGGTPEYQNGGPIIDPYTGRPTDPTINLGQSPNFSQSYNTPPKYVAPIAAPNFGPSSSQPSVPFQQPNLKLPVAPIAPPNFGPSASGQPTVPFQQPTFNGGTGAFNGFGITAGQSSSPGDAPTSPMDKAMEFLNGNSGINASAMLKVPGTAYNLIKGMGKATEDPLRLNRQMSNSINLMADRNYDPEAAQQAITRQSNAARARVEGTNPFLSNAQNQGITNSAQGQAAQANLQGQQMNNQYRAQEAATRAQLGSEERNIQRDRDVSNLQNTAARNSFLQQSFADMSSIGDAINQGKVTEAQIEEGMTILKNKYPNVDIQWDAINEKLKKGEDLSETEIFQLRIATQFLNGQNNGNQ